MISRGRTLNKANPQIPLLYNNAKLTILYKLSVVP